MTLLRRSPWRPATPSSLGIDAPRPRGRLPGRLRRSTWRRSSSPRWATATATPSRRSPPDMTRAARRRRSTSSSSGAATAWSPVPRDAATPAHRPRHLDQRELALRGRGRAPRLPRRGRQGARRPRRRGPALRAGGRRLAARPRGYGDDKDRVLIRSDGEPTYFLSDIAYHRDKIDRGFEHLIDIWGADHHGYVPRMKAAFTALPPHDPDRLELIIGQFVNLLEGGEQKRMSQAQGRRSSRSTT